MQVVVIEAFTSTPRYLVDLLKNDNAYFDKIVDSNYLIEQQLNKTNASDTKAPFPDLNRSISNDITSAEIRDKILLLA